MYGSLMRIDVKPGMRSDLLDYLRWDAEVAKQHEPGTLRFDVWETEREPDIVYLYEAYTDSQAFEEHKKGEPYKKWDEIARNTMRREPEELIPFMESVLSNVDA